jgi:ketosteroid isomerase-like protein
MSHENVQAVPIGPVWDAIDALDAEALVSLCDPRVRFESRITSVENETYEGHDGVRRYIANLADAFEWIQVNGSDVVQEGERAVATNHFRACGRGSGVEVEQEFFVAMKGHEGKALWWRFFDSRSEALEAMGMSA